MKTKALSILALLLTVTQGAWAQLGRVLATDGKYYKTVTAATNAGTTASGMIVYWGDGDTSDNTYNQGLVIALSDVVNNGQWGAQQQDVTDITNTGRDATISMVDLRGIANTDAIVSKWPTGTYSYAADHCVSMSTARPSSSSNWFLPSQGQFVLMMNSYGAGYGTSTSYEYNNINKGAVVTAINNALTNAGGTALSNGRYWTSTEPDYKVAADWAADNSSFGLNDKTLEQNVRAMFAFSGATAAEYTVSYNANGGSGAPDAQTKDGGIDLTLSSTVPTRDGYTFAGWATSADGAVAYSAGGSYTTNNDIVLYAQWTSTYTVTVKSSTDDATNWQGKAGTGEYQSLPLTGLEAGTAVSVKYSGTKMVKSVKARKKAAAPSVPDGAINGKFSVSDTKQVYFSKGNLRYASGTWSFFDNQYDYYTSYRADAWDKFGWSTSAITYGMNTSTDKATYSGDFVDWGATMGTGWFTLSSDEWTYLLNTRTSGGTVFGTSSARYAHATINTDGTGVNGMILFPDGVDIASTEVTTAGTVNNTSAYATKCTTAQWSALAAKGCVFLPAAGFRGQASVNGAGSYGYYWSSSPYTSDAYRAYLAFFSSGTLNPASYSYRNVGYSVRLVQATSDAAPATPATTDLSTISADYEAKNGETLTGTLTNNVKISIADGATVTLKDVTITNLGNSCNWAGINCPGDATLVLEGTNEVCAGREGDYEWRNYPGIWIAPNKTLTIQGAGTLTAYSGGPYPDYPYGAGIGGGFCISCGNIVINSGTITATGGGDAAGIGAGSGTGSCGNITINGGTVEATGDGGGAGIGGGYGIDCGNITISGGTVSATGGYYAAGIGGGRSNGACGTITIKSTVTSVTATKGSVAPNSIGSGGENGTAITVTIGGNEGAITTSPYTYDPSASTARTAAEVTAGDIGKIVGKDGKIYATKADAEAVATGNAVAMIAYVGSETGVAGYTHGLALALTDESSSGMYWNDAKTACTNKNTSATVESASWMLPSKDQWNKMIDACKNVLGDNDDSRDLRDGFTSVGGSNMESKDYWSSTEYENDSNKAWMFNFGYDCWYDYPKAEEAYPQVRACLAF